MADKLQNIRKLSSFISVQHWHFTAEHPIQSPLYADYLRMQGSIVFCFVSFIPNVLTNMQRLYTVKSSGSGHDRPKYSMRRPNALPLIITSSAPRTAKYGLWQQKRKSRSKERIFPFPLNAKIFTLQISIPELEQFSCSPSATFEPFGGFWALRRLLSPSASSECK